MLTLAITMVTQYPRYAQINRERKNGTLYHDTYRGRRIHSNATAYREMSQNTVKMLRQGKKDTDITVHS